MAQPVEQARAAFARSLWRKALDAYEVSLTDTSLAAVDHERRAICAYLVGADETCAAASEAGYRAALADDPAAAAQCAFWLALCLMLRGHVARAGGWLHRARRLIVERTPDCAARATC